MNNLYADYNNKHDIKYLRNYEINQPKYIFKFISSYGQMKYLIIEFFIIEYFDLKLKQR